jgi:2-dehydro-3-deoxyglucarate aldolase/4-hydroxy-2-oxoheptanedioate aldolase
MLEPKKATLKRRLADGRGIGLFWLALGGVSAVEAAVAAGAEGIVIDMQHGLFDRLALESAIGCVPPEIPCLVRVEDHSPRAIGTALDAGAEGVIVPLVETGRQAATVAAAAHYPPKGVRSGGGVRPLRNFGAYVAGAPEAIAVGVMIETTTGVKNAVAIAATKNVDFVFIGTGDLALSLGAAPGSTAHSRACGKILRACRKVGTACGTFSFGGKAAAERLAEGYALAVVHNDISALNDAFRAEAAAFREGRGPSGGAA